jgi:glycosyltransferase involved in cell wall biosynthesis
MSAPAMTSMTAAASETRPSSSPRPQSAASDPARTPRVSVVMPVYNGQRYLAESVESILAQTLVDFEFIIVDDGSTDHSLAMLREYAQTDDRIRIQSRPNTGISGALNDGLAVARAELIARMDADDISVPDRFERQVAYLDAHPEIVALGTSVELIDPAGLPIGLDHTKQIHEDIERQLLKGRGGSLYHPSALIRRRAIQQIGGYRAQYNDSEDLDLWLRLAEVGRLANLPQPLLKYRRHLESVTHRKYENQWKLKRAIVAEAYQRRGEPMPADWTFAPWKPKPVAHQLREWAWMALKSGHRSAARRHAMEAWRRSPFSSASWRVVLCALRGH